MAWAFGLLTNVVVDDNRQANGPAVLDESSSSEVRDLCAPRVHVGSPAGKAVGGMRCAPSALHGPISPIRELLQFRSACRTGANLRSAARAKLVRPARLPTRRRSSFTADAPSEPGQGLDGGASTQHAFEELRRRILQGELAPGATFSQVQLSNQLGVSRTPLREAVRLLQMEGLLRAEARRRVRVSPPSTDDFEDLYAIRISLESLAVRLTVPQLTEAELADTKLAYLEWSAAVSQADLAGGASLTDAFTSRCMPTPARDWSTISATSGTTPSATGCSNGRTRAIRRSSRGSRTATTPAFSKLPRTATRFCAPGAWPSISPAPL